MTASTAQAGYNAGLFITSVPSVTMTNEAMTNAGDNATFNDGTVAHQAWDYSASFTIQTEVDDVQTVSITGAPTGGTFTLTFGGNTTTGIAYNAPATGAGSVQTALQALASIGAGNATVTGSAGGPWQVDFTGSLGYAAQTLMTTSGAGLTGGTSPASHVAHTQGGFTWTTQSSGFTINYAIGQVVFTTAYFGNSNTPACRVTGKYFTIAFLAGVTSIDGTGTGAALDTTAMTNPPSSWKTFISGERSATLKLSTIWVNGGVFLAHMSANDILLLRVYPNQANTQRYQGYGVMTTDSFKSAVSAVNTEEIDFNINGQLYYLAV
jgi:hypothetical protein